MNISPTVEGASMFMFFNIPVLPSRGVPIMAGMSC